MAFEEADPKTNSTSIYDLYAKLSSDYEELKRKYEKCLCDLKKYELIIKEQKKELLDRLNSEEETLERLKAHIYRYNQLEAMYAHISKKYELLSNSKLGRLTLNYWKFRKRIPKDF